MRIMAVKIMKERALGFLRDAEIDFSEGRYDLCIFHCEQAIQLLAKAKILEVAGSSPETHNLREILGILYYVTRDERIKEFCEKNRQVLIILEDAYFLARYFPRKYEKEDAELCLKVTKEFFGLLS